MTQLKRTILVLALGTAFTPSPKAFAQGTPAVEWSQLSKKKKAKLKKKAKRFSKKAKKAYAKKEWDKAIIAFELAYQKYPDPRYLFNIGRCYEKKGDLFKAMEWTQRYVEMTAVGEEREDAEDMVEMLQVGLRKTSGEVDLTTTPPGATVVLAGSGQEITGKTPIRRWLLAGAWKAKLHMPGHLPADKVFSVGLGEVTKVAVTMKKEGADEPPPPPPPPPEEKAEEAKVLAEGDPQPPVAPPQAPPPATEEPAQAAEDGLGWPVLASLGVATAALAGGAAFALTAKARREELADMEGAGADYSEVKAKHDSAESAVSVANALFVVGGVAALAGGAMWMMDDGGQVSVQAGPGAVSLRGTFR